MKEHDGPITAGDLMSILEKDPEYQAMMADQRRATAEKEAAYMAAEAPLRAELANVGIKVKWVWDLVNTRFNYDQAIPVLIDHIQRPYPDKVKEGIGRALAVPSAISGWNTLINEYEKTNYLTEKGAKDGLACAVSGAANDSVIGDVLRLIRDPSHGQSRILLLWALKKSKRPEAKQTLLELAEDPVLGATVRSFERRRRK